MERSKIQKLYDKVNKQYFTSKKCPLCGDEETLDGYEGRTTVCNNIKCKYTGVNES